MASLYTKQTKFLVAVDCIIFGFDDEELKLLLIKRNFEPDLGMWSLVGHFLLENEKSEDAANRVLKQLTGLDNVYMRQVRTFSDPKRDPAAHTLSIAYYALVNIQDHNEQLRKENSAHWISLKELPELVFDHSEMVRLAIKELQYKTSVQPVGFELLPPKFTMRQLQKLYEAIFQEEFDKRNFAKKINKLDVLVKLDEKDMTSSKKGSYLYSFDQEKYEAKLQNGFSFKL